jgi:alkylation response protein AidB-like acyl-CoA dehydrogenase
MPVELQLTTDQELLAETTARFLADTSPLTEVRRLAAVPAGFEETWWRRGAALGWTSMLVPEDLGGGSLSGDGLRDLAVVAEERGRLVAPGPFVPVNVVASALAGSAAKTVHAPLIAALTAGSATAAWCLDEPGAAFGAAGVELRATSVADGFRLDGVKAPVEAGGEADHLLVVARHDGRLVQVLVPATAEGVRRRPLASLDLVRRYAAVELDGVIVPAAALVSGPDEADDAVETELLVACVLQLAETLGAITRVFEFTVEWAFDRYTFGRPIASYQALKHRFADMKLWLEASAATTTAAVRAVQSGSADAGELVSVAKSYVGEHAPELVQDCVQMHGGIGVTWDHDIHLYLRRVTLNSQLFGTPTDHRLRLAAVAGLV